MAMSNMTFFMQFFVLCIQFIQMMSCKITLKRQLNSTKITYVSIRLPNIIDTRANFSFEDEQFIDVHWSRNQGWIYISNRTIETYHPQQVSLVISQQYSHHTVWQYESLTMSMYWTIFWVEWSLILEWFQRIYKDQKESFSYTLQPHRWLICYEQSTLPNRARQTTDPSVYHRSARVVRCHYNTTREWEEEGKEAYKQGLVVMNSMIELRSEILAQNGVIVFNDRRVLIGNPEHFCSFLISLEPWKKDDIQFGYISIPWIVSSPRCKYLECFEAQLFVSWLPCSDWSNTSGSWWGYSIENATIHPHHSSPWVYP